MWNAEEELLDYCKNDVNILAEVVKLHHDMCMMFITKYDKSLSISPWHFTTSAGFMRKLSLLEMSHNLDKNEQAPEETEKVAEENWVALEAEEHYFTKLAQRGGRTEVRIHNYAGKINCFDFHSMVNIH